MKMKNPSPKQVRAIQDDYNWRNVKRVLDDEGVSASPIRLSYWNFFKELNGKATRTMDKDAQKARVDEIKGKYERKGLKRETLGKLAKLVPLKM
jgi:hypothetical protein